MRHIVVGLATVACCLPLCWLSGCGCNRHGILIRGGCSLELNRLPWRTGVPVEYDQEACGCEEADCGGGAGCAVGAVNVQPAGPPPVPDQACYGGPPGPLSWLFAGLRGGCGPSYGCQGCQTGYMVEPVAETGPIHSRFHPVPTRPVFQSPPPISPPIAGGPFPEGPTYLASANHASTASRRVPPPSLDIQVPEPPPEAYPAAPLPPRDREARAPQPENTASNERSWVFAPGAGNDGWRTARARATPGPDARRRPLR